MKPDPSTQQDVPAWLLPTVAQNTLPHPVVVDYLPWPKLRDYLCLSGDPDTRHSFDFYFESTRLKLPPNCLVFTKDDWGRVSVSPEFEAAASHLSNWVIGPPWSEAFPHLVRLTQV